MASIDLTVPVRWADLDAYGHVNNAAVMTLLEEARIAAFWPVPAEQAEHVSGPAPMPLPVGGAGSPVQTVIASQRIEYARTLEHRRDGVVVRLWISRVGGASLSVDYLVLTQDDLRAERPAVRARTVVVMIDAETGAPVRLDESVRAALMEFAGEPLTFRD